MFISFSKTLAKVGVFRLGLRMRVSKKNILWFSIVYLIVVTCQLAWYTMVFAAWFVYAFFYGIYLCIKLLFQLIRKISKTKDKNVESRAIEENA